MAQPVHPSAEPEGEELLLLDEVVLDVTVPVTPGVDGFAKSGFYMENVQKINDTKLEKH